MISCFLFIKQLILILCTYTLLPVVLNINANDVNINPQTSWNSRLWNPNLFANHISSSSSYNPSPLISSQRSLPAVKINPNGKVYTTQILKQQLSNELCLPLRDLRVVDPSLPKQIQAIFTSRPNAILFCVENIKVVVQRHEALVFNPHQPEVQEFIPVLQQILQSSSNNNIQTDSTNSNSNMRFEHMVIEAALNVVCSSLFRQVRALSPAVSSTLNGLRAESRGLDVVQTQVDELLPLKNKLDELRKRIKEVKRAIMDILNNDEDMVMMYLSNNFNSTQIQSQSYSTEVHSLDKHENQIDITSFNEKIKVSQITTSAPKLIDTMDLEMLFENYLNEVEWIASEIEEIIDEVTNTEEYVVLQLDLLRNRILRFELLLSVSSFVITCGALVTGLFGMNLLNHFEMHKNMFYVVFVTLVISMIGIFNALTKYGKREKLF